MWFTFTFLLLLHFVDPLQYFGVSTEDVDIFSNIADDFELRTIVCEFLTFIAFRESESSFRLASSSADAVR